MNLKTLLTQLEENQKNFIDFVINSKTASYEDGILDISKGDLPYRIEIADTETRAELCGRIGLPVSYFTTLFTDHKKELNRTVGYWLRYAKKPMLIRCLKRSEDSILGRAILSNKYHIINHYDAVSDLVRQIKKRLGVNPVLARYVPEIGSKRMLLELDLPDIRTNISGLTGIDEDSAIMGVYLGNSELGRGVFYIQPYVRFQSGLIMLLKQRFTRVHLGKEIEAGVYEFGEHPVDLSLSSVFELVHSVVDILNVETLNKAVDELYSELAYITPKSKTDAIEGYLKAIGATTDESVHTINAYLQSDSSALSAFFAYVKGVQVASPDGDRYENLDNARILATSFGNIKKRK